VISYCLLLDKQQVSVNLHVYYANHCYTRSRMANDPADAVLFREWKKDGTLEQQQWLVHLRPTRYQRTTPTVALEYP